MWLSSVYKRHTPNDATEKGWKEKIGRCIQGKFKQNQTGVAVTRPEKVVFSP